MCCFFLEVGSVFTGLEAGSCNTFLSLRFVADTSSSHVDSSGVLIKSDLRYYSPTGVVVRDLPTMWSRLYPVPWYILELNRLSNCVVLV